MADADQEFSSWMHEWADLLVRFTYGHTKDLGLAQDIAQETFLRAFQKFSRRNRPLPSPGWMYLVASRLAIDSYRKRRREVSLAEAPPLSMMKLDADWNPRVFEGVMALPPRDRECLVLFYYRDCSIEQICDRLRIPSATVRTRLYRARQRLRTLLAKEGDD